MQVLSSDRSIDSLNQIMRINCILRTRTQTHRKCSAQKISINIKKITKNLAFDNDNNSLRIQKSLTKNNSIKNNSNLLIRVIKLVHHIK